MRVHKKNIFIVFVIVMGLNCLSHAGDSEYQKIDPNKVPDKLAELASVIKANYEKIKHWQGKIAYHSVQVSRGSIAAAELKEFTEIKLSEEPNEVYKAVDGTIDFKIDMRNNRYFIASNRPDSIDYVNPQNNMIYKSLSGPSQEIKIVTPDYQIKIYPYRRTKDYVTLEKRASKERPIRTEGEDPREAFNVARPIWEVLSRFSQVLKMKGVETYGVVIEEKVDGNNMIYRIEIFDPGKSQPSSIIILSSEAGFNPVYVEQRHDNGSVTKGTREFVKIDGVFLPNKWNMSLYYPDGGLMRDVIRNMSDMQVNVPIPDTVFSEKSYLREGEKLIDRTNNKKEFVLKAGKFVEIADANLVLIAEPNNPPK